MKKHEGKYITSHSMMLAELSCAIAAQAEMGTPKDFLKLVFASFLHDLSLTDNQLARLSDVNKVMSSPVFSDEQKRAFQLHPIKAAEYARQFQEIPQDVDTIISQHHELPDGSGFPRKLTHSQISPLSSVFIFAHDLLSFMLLNVPAKDRMSMISTFLARNPGKYDKGNFGKITAQVSRSDL